MSMEQANLVQDSSIKTWYTKVMRCVTRNALYELRRTHAACLQAIKDPSALLKVFEPIGERSKHFPYAGFNVVHVAAFSGFTDVLAYLVDKMKYNLWERTPCGNTALSLAVLRNQASVVGWICERNDVPSGLSDLLVNERRYRQTPIHIALLKGNSTILGILIRFYARHSLPLDMANTNPHGPKTVLELAVYGQDVNCFKLLVDTGIIVTTSSVNSVYPATDIPDYMLGNSISLAGKYYVVPHCMYARIPINDLPPPCRMVRINPTNTKMLLYLLGLVKSKLGSLTPKTCLMESMDWLSLGMYCLEALGQCSDIDSYDVSEVVEFCLILSFDARTRSQVLPKSLLRNDKDLSAVAAACHPLRYSLLEVIAKSRYLQSVLLAMLCAAPSHVVCSCFRPFDDYRPLHVTASEREYLSVVLPFVSLVKKWPALNVDRLKVQGLSDWTTALDLISSRLPLATSSIKRWLCSSLSSDYDGVKTVADCVKACASNVADRPELLLDRSYGHLLTVLNEAIYSKDVESVLTLTSLLRHSLYDFETGYDERYCSKSTGDTIAHSLCRNFHYTFLIGSLEVSPVSLLVWVLSVLLSSRSIETEEELTDKIRHFVAIRNYRGETCIDVLCASLPSTHTSGLFTNVEQEPMVARLEYLKSIVSTLALDLADPLYSWLSEVPSVPSYMVKQRHDDRGMPALIAAIKYQDQALVRYLVDRTPHSNKFRVFLGRENAEYMTAAQYAIKTSPEMGRIFDERVIAPYNVPPADDATRKIAALCARPDPHEIVSWRANRRGGIKAVARVADDMFDIHDMLYREHSSVSSAPVAAVDTRETNEQVWITVRVFLSSPFVSYEKEREHITKYIIPALSEEWYASHINVVLVDLRWGVSGEDDVRAMNICLKEVSRSHVLIGLYGPDRMGHVPLGPPTEFTNMFRPQWSLTAQEFVVGLETDGPSDMYPAPRLCLFAERSCVAETDTSASRMFHEVSVYVNKVQGIRSGSVRSVTYGSNEEEFIMLMKSELQLAVAQAAAAIRRNESSTSGDPHLTYAAYRVMASGAIRRPAVMDRVNTYLSNDSADSRVMLIEGKPGSGKSTLLAQVVCENKKCVYHCVSADPASVHVSDVLNRICVGVSNLVLSLVQRSVAIYHVHASPAVLEIIDRDVVPGLVVGNVVELCSLYVAVLRGDSTMDGFLGRLAIPREADDSSSILDKQATYVRSMMNFYSALCDIICHMSKMASPPFDFSVENLQIVIDAINQMSKEDTGYHKLLPCFQQPLPSHVRVVLSVASNSPKVRKDLFRGIAPDFSAGASGADPLVLVTVSALSRQEKDHVMRSRLGLISKDVDQAQLDLLAEKHDSNTPLFLALSCDYLVYSAVYETLAGLVIALPHTTPELCQLILYSLERDFGSTVVGVLSSLVSLSGGWCTESDLISALELLDPSCIGRGRVALCVLRQYLRVGSTGGTDWCHMQFMHAVEARYLLGPRSVMKYLFSGGVITDIDHTVGSNISVCSRCFDNKELSAADGVLDMKKFVHRLLGLYYLSVAYDLSCTDHLVVGNKRSEILNNIVLHCINGGLNRHAISYVVALPVAHVRCNSSGGAKNVKEDIDRVIAMVSQCKASGSILQPINSFNGSSCQSCRLEGVADITGLVLNSFDDVALFLANLSEFLLRNMAYLCQSQFANFFQLCFNSNSPSLSIAAAKCYNACYGSCARVMNAPVRAVDSNGETTALLCDRKAVMRAPSEVNISDGADLPNGGTTLSLEVTGHKDGSVNLWDRKSGVAVPVLSQNDGRVCIHPGRVLTLNVLTLDSKTYLVVGHSQGSVSIYSMRAVTRPEGLACECRLLLSFSLFGVCEGDDVEARGVFSCCVSRSDNGYRAFFGCKDGRVAGVLLSPAPLSCGASLLMNDPLFVYSGTPVVVHETALVSVAVYSSDSLNTLVCGSNEGDLTFADFDHNLCVSPMVKLAKYHTCAIIRVLAIRRNQTSYLITACQDGSVSFLPWARADHQISIPRFLPFVPRVYGSSDCVLGEDELYVNRNLHRDCVHCLCLLSDDMLVTGSWDHKVLVWDIDQVLSGTPSCLMQYEHSHYVNFVRSVDDKTLVSCCVDRTATVLGVRRPASSAADQKHDIKVWRDVIEDEANYHRLEVQQKPLHSHIVRGLCSYVTSDGRAYIVTGSWDYFTKFWELSPCASVLSSKAVSLKPLSTPHNVHGDKRVNGACIMGQYVASCGGDGRICLYDTAGVFICRSAEGHDGQALCVTSSDDGEMLISGGTNGAAMLWVIKDRDLRLTSTLKPSPEAVTSCSFVPGGHDRVLLGQASGVLGLWETKNGSLLYQFRPTHTKPIIALSFSLDGTHFVSGGEDHKLCLYDAHDGGVVAFSTVHTNEVTCAVFLNVKRSKMFLSGSSDGSIRLWEWRGEQSLYCVSSFFFEHSIMSLCLVKNFVLAGDSCGRVYVLSITC